MIREPFFRQPRQSGVAVITALLIVALAAVIAVGLVSKGNVHMHRTENILARDQGAFYVLGAERLAALILIADDDLQVDGVTDIWAQPTTPLPFDGGTITGALSDMQGKFNLNNLVDSNGVAKPSDNIQVEYFRSLVLNLGLRPEIVGYLIDWMDADSTPYTGGGAEDADYLLSDPAYRTANHKLVHISELRLIKGFESGQDPDPYDTLRSFVTVLPEETAINVNFAPAQILKALSTNVTDGSIKTFIEQREQAPISSYGQFMGILFPVTNSQPQPNLNNLVTVQTDFYQLQTQIDFAERQLQYTSQLHRQSAANVITLMRTPGIEYVRTP
jgi:general secretion pathway protein K